jgi:hypothetical protein
VFTGNSFTGVEKSDDAFVIQVAPNGRVIDGGAGIDHGDDVEVAPSGAIVVGADAAVDARPRVGPPVAAPGDGGHADGRTVGRSRGTVGPGGQPADGQRQHYVRRRV